MLWTWLVWLPIAAGCFYVAWGYAASGGDGHVLSVSIEVLLALVGVGVIARSAIRTRRWLRKAAGE